MRPALWKVLGFALGGALFGTGLSRWGTVADSARPHGLLVTTAIWAGLAAYVGVLFAAAAKRVREMPWTRHHRHSPNR